MRLIEVGGFLVVLGGCAVVFRSLWRRTLPRVEWVPYHCFEDGRRRVFVRCGAETEPVGDVDPDDPDYDVRFMELMDRARERAAILNSER